MTPHVPDHEVELYREDDAYTVIVDIPDASHEDIGVHYHDRRLDISTDAGDTGDSAPVKSHSVSLPHAIEEESIRATYDEGVLEVALPITEADTHPGTEIEVE
jgi:HSP20 family protein